MQPAGVVPTFENVAPLVADSHVGPDGIEYLFRCPVTGFEARATVAMSRPGAPADPNVAGVFIRGTAEGETQNAAEDAADRALPGASFISGLASDVLRLRRHKRASKSSAAPPPDVPDMKQVLVRAFGQVADEFTWDAAGQRWVHAAS
jgi:hypothetical protein